MLMIQHFYLVCPLFSVPANDLVLQNPSLTMYTAPLSKVICDMLMLFGGLPKSKLDTLQHLQERVRSIIDNARLKDGWLTVEQLIKFDRSFMTYTIINRQCPESLWDKYHQRIQISNRITRNYRNLQIPRNNLEYVKKGFHYSALKAWNDIPIDIRELPTLSRFKQQLKCYFKS